LKQKDLTLETPDIKMRMASPDKKLELDPEKFEKVLVPGKKVTFSFDKPCMVRVIARNKGRYYSVLKTIVDWEYREPGEYTEIWDGKNDKGDIIDTEANDITVETQPRHGSADYDETEEYVLPKEYILRKEKGLKGQRGAVVPKGHDHLRWDHSAHAHDKCHKLPVEITDVSLTKDKGEGFYTVKVTIGEDGEKRGYGKDKISEKKDSRPMGHSIRIYVDNYLFDEDKLIDGDKAEWLLDASQIPQGEHTLTVSVCDHHDHHGGDSVKINVS
jgi:hypothetical protein